MSVDADIYCGVIPKHPDDVVFLVFDFGDEPELATGGQTILSASIPAVTGINVTGVVPLPVGSPYRVGAWYSGGTDGIDYDVKCTANFSDGTTVKSRVGTLAVTTKRR